MSYFSTTHWSVVLEAGHGQTDQAREALESLCRTYWYPLYAYARLDGLSHHDAEDLTQSFFTHLIEHELIARADREKGRFRTFLLACFKNFRASEVERARTRKRGGNVTLVSIDELQAQERFAREQKDAVTPETLYERNWALLVFDQAQSLLETEYAQANQDDLFRRLRGFLQGTRDSVSYADIADEVQKSEAAIKMEVSRMRRRFRELLRSVVGQTVADAVEVENEFRHLVQVLSH